MRMVRLCFVVCVRIRLDAGLKGGGNGYSGVKERTLILCGDLGVDELDGSE